MEFTAAALQQAHEKALEEFLVEKKRLEENFSQTFDEESIAHFVGRREQPGILLGEIQRHPDGMTPVFDVIRQAHAEKIEKHKAVSAREELEALQTQINRTGNILRSYIRAVYVALVEHQIGNPDLEDPSSIVHSPNNHGIRNIGICLALEELATSPPDEEPETLWAALRTGHNLTEEEQCQIKYLFGPDGPFITALRTHGAQGGRDCMANQDFTPKMMRLLEEAIRQFEEHRQVAERNMERSRILPRGGEEIVR